MQICKKNVQILALLALFTTNLFAQLSVPSVSAPSISGPTAPTLPTINSNSTFTSPSVPGTTTTNSTQKSTTEKKTQESAAGMDLTSETLSAVSGLFGVDSSLLGADSMTDIYSLLENDLNSGKNGTVNNLVFEQILTKLEEIEGKLENTSKSDGVLNFSIVNSKTNEVSNLLPKMKNLSIGNKKNDSFVLSGTIIHNAKDTSLNETFYMDFKLLNTHTYEVNFTVHTNNEKSILKEMASHGPYKAIKTANYVTMSIFGPEYYLDLVFSIDF